MDLIPWGALLICLAVYAAFVLALVVLGRGTDARALAGFIPDSVRMVRALMAAPSATRAQRLGIAVLVAYLLLPFDLIPDFIPIVGVLDDAIVVALALRLLLKTHSESEIRAAWPGPDRSLRIVLRAAGARTLSAD